MLKWKIEPIKALKEKGYTTYKLSKEGILSPSTIQNLRDKKKVNWDIIDRICEMLQCQVGDILEYTKE